MSDLIIEDCEFWFVWTKKGHFPRFVHNTQAAAEAEADRLAQLKPHGRKFIVLRGYRKCHVPAALAVAPSGASCLPQNAVAASAHLEAAQ